jgi:hypothetical protein
VIQNFSDATSGGLLTNSALLYWLASFSRLPAGTPERFRVPFIRGFYDAQQRLGNNPKCGGFFGGQGLNAMNSTEYRFIPFGSPTTGEQTSIKRMYKSTRRGHS